MKIDDAVLELAIETWGIDAQCEMVIEEGFINPPETSLINGKREKIEKFLLYSKERGTLTK